MNYWFRPKRFWRYFAFFVPASIKGWIFSVVLFAATILAFVYIDSNSHSISDTLLNFSPWLVIILVISDIFTLKFGEYPYWWKK